MALTPTRPDQRIQRAQQMQVQITQMEAEAWMLVSASSQLPYTIRRVASNCSFQNCELIRSSKVCRHMYSCTCLDYTKGKLCKHCYRIHQQFGSPIPEPPVQVTVKTGTDRRTKFDAIKKRLCADALSVVNALTTASEGFDLNFEQGLMLQIVESLKAKGCTLNPPSNFEQSLVVHPNQHSEKQILSPCGVKRNSEHRHKSNSRGASQTTNTVN